MKFDAEKICDCSDVEATDIRKIDGIYYHELCGHPLYGVFIEIETEKPK